MKREEIFLKKLTIMYSSSNYLSWDYTVLNSLIRKSTSCRQGATGLSLNLLESLNSIQIKS